MRAILINVYDRTIMDVAFNGSLQGMYDLIRCSCVQAIQTRIGGAHNDLWIDEEGCLREGVPAFILDGFSQPLAGNGLLCGGNARGGTVDVKATVEQVSQYIQFTDLFTTGQFTPPREIEPPQGFDFVIDTGKPIFTTKLADGEG